MSKRVLLTGLGHRFEDVSDNAVAIRDEQIGGWYRDTGRTVTLEVWEYELPERADV